jgi:RNA polymerase sigma-70 factor (ECF subfamily)
VRQNRENISDMTLRWGKAQPSVTAYVRSIVSNHHDAEDIIQTTVAHLIDHFDEYDPARPFVAWAIGIARIRILHYRDQRLRKPLLLGDDAIDALSSAIADESTAMDERLEALEHCIGRLSEKHRRVISMRYREKVSRKEIADSLGIRENSVSVLLRRVRNVLETCVTERLGGEST